jgi:glycosyltransferase involved in cell wall biosynthesis
VRIAFLTWRDTTHPDGGGSEVFVERVARELVAAGHDVTIRCAAHGTAPRRERVEGVEVVRGGGRLGVYPSALWWLVRQRRRVDVVVDVINGVPFGTPLVRRHRTVALVHHLHERQWHIIYPGLRGHVGWFLEGTLVPRLYRRRRHLTVSEATRRDLAGLGIPAERVAVARNGLDARPYAGPRDERPRLSVLARLVPHKQIEHALQLVADLRSAGRPVPLDVIGDGWWRSTLEHRARRLRVTDLVTFHGHVDDDERDRLLARSWVMVLPSVKEGWGLAILEAAAQGTPTVAYREAGGVAEAIEDGRTGVLADSYASLRSAVTDLLDAPERRDELGAAARERAAGFTWSATARTVEQVLELELSGRRS